MIPQAYAGSIGGPMSDALLKKLIVSAIALFGFVVWSYCVRVVPEECTSNYATDFSAIRK
jgi:hypothetical protein